MNGQASVGAICGVFIALMVLTLTPLEPNPLLILSGVGLGAVSGAILGAVAGSRQLRGKAMRTLHSGLIGGIIGFIPSLFLVVAVIGSHRAILIAFVTPVVIGSLIGGIIGRAGHAGRVTVGELMAWVAVVACAL